MRRTLRKQEKPCKEDCNSSRGRRQSRSSWTTFRCIGSWSTSCFLIEAWDHTAYSIIEPLSEYLKNLKKWKLCSLETAWRLMSARRYHSHRYLGPCKSHLAHNRSSQNIRSSAHLPGQWWRRCRSPSHARGDWLFLQFHRKGKMLGSFIQSLQQGLQNSSRLP